MKEKYIFLIGFGTGMVTIAFIGILVYNLMGLNFNKTLQNDLKTKEIHKFNSEFIEETEKTEITSNSG